MSALLAQTNGIPAPVWAALAALMMAATAVLQEWLRARRERLTEIERATREKEAAEKVAAEVKEVKAALGEKDTKIAGALGEIHTAVNSNLDKMKAELKVSNDQNAALQVMVGQLMKVIAPVSAAVVKNGTDPLFPPPTDVAVDKLIKAVEARTAAPQAAAPPAPGTAPAPVEVINLPAVQKVEVVDPKSKK